MNNLTLKSVADFSIKVCKMVEVTSPLQDPTAIIPTANDATPITSMLDFASANTGRSNWITSVLFEPVTVYTYNYIWYK